MSYKKVPYEEKQILRINDITRHFGPVRSQIDTWRKAGVFPKPVKLSPRTFGYWKSEVEECFRNRTVEA